MSYYDAIIIGAGIAGTSLAASLARQGKVLLLDMESQPGYHATGRSAAYYAPAYGSQVVREITVAGGAFFKTPPDGFSEAPLLKPRPSLFIASETQVETLNQELRASPHLKSVDKTALKQHVGILKTDKITHGALDETGGDLDVDALMQGYLRAFSRFKGQLLTSTMIKTIGFKDNVYTVSDGTNAYQSPKLINAAGAWADQIAEMAGLSGIGIQPKRRTALLVDAPTQFDITDWPLVIDIDENFYFKPDAGQLLISPADETPVDAADVYPDELDIAIAIDRVQQVVDLEVKRVNHSWAGLRSFAPDNNFVTGFDPRQPGFFWLAGQGGYGVQSAPGLSDMATHLITGSCQSLSQQQIDRWTDEISPDRFL